MMDRRVRGPSASLRADVRGATMVEYLIIIAIVGVAALGAWVAFGGTVTSKLDEQGTHIATLTPGSAGSVSAESGAPIAPPTAGAAPAALGGTESPVGGAPPMALSSPPEGGSDDDGDGGGRAWWESAAAFGWSTVKGVGLGAWDTVTGLVSLAGAAGSGAWWVVTHPGEAASGAWHAVTHPAETASAAWGLTKAVAGGVWNWLGGAWDTVLHGTAEERGDLLGRGLFEAALTIGTGGAGHAAKARFLGKVDDLADAARLAENVDDAADAARLAENADDAAAAAAAARLAENAEDAASPLARVEERLYAPIPAHTDEALRLTERWEDIERRAQNLRTAELSPAQQAALREARESIDANHRMGHSSTLARDATVAARNWRRADGMIDEWVRTGEPITIERIQELNAILRDGNPIDNWVDNRGVLRTPGLDVSAGGHPLQTYVAGDDVAQAMRNFDEWLAASTAAGMDPVEQAARAYQSLVSIHPFTDANGRTSRMVMDWILKKNGLPPAAIEEPYVAVFAHLPTYNQYVDYAPVGAAASDAARIVTDGVERSLDVLERALADP